MIKLLTAIPFLMMFHSIYASECNVKIFYNAHSYIWYNSTSGGSVSTADKTDITPVSSTLNCDSFSLANQAEPFKISCKKKLSGFSAELSFFDSAPLRLTSFDVTFPKNRSLSRFIPTHGLSIEFNDSGFYEQEFFVDQAIFDSSRGVFQNNYSKSYKRLQSVTLTCEK